jgi:hypothetical protein
MNPSRNHQSHGGENAPVHATPAGCTAGLAEQNAG